MEKIMIASGDYHLTNPSVLDINTCLSNGWTVKSITTTTVGKQITAIFVLERKD